MSDETPPEPLEEPFHSVVTDKLDRILSKLDTVLEQLEKDQRAKTLREVSSGS